MIVNLISKAEDCEAVTLSDVLFACVLSVTLREDRMLSCEPNFQRGQVGTGVVHHGDTRR